MDEKWKKEVIEWVKSIAIAVLLAFTIKYFICDIILVDGSSMNPTLYNGDRVFVNIIGMRITKVEHSDIIVFTPSIEPDSFYIKRIIGLPGDIVRVKDGKVSINGTELDEPYLAPGTETFGDLEIKVPEDKVFVMGDNRENSEDSRDPQLGPVPIKSVKGKAVFRLFPFSDIKKL